ncbi:MAG: BatA domain-containing protein [Candidatus Brocadiia bacterium]
MNFLHPEYWPLAPLLAAPIVIHLLNRIRYRRVRWAAIQFLLATERRAISRARLRQLLLMALRVLVLAAALGALLQPILRGALAAVLGKSSQVAVVLDASASMSATDATGSAFERAKELAAQTLASLPRGARVTAGTFGARYRSPFREPLQDRKAVASVLRSAELTGGTGHVPAALRAAAQALQRTGGGGTIWLLTDLRAADWHAADEGAWDRVRQALRDAGEPHIVVSDVGPELKTNLAIAGIRVAPAVLVEGDAPKLTATVQLHGEGKAAAQLALFLDGERVDTRTVELAGPGKTDCVFHLPALDRSVHAGRLELGPDALPGDDRCYFVLRTKTRLPVLVVDGAPSTRPLEGAADFLRLALRPRAGHPTERSRLEPEAIPPARLGRAELEQFVAVFLADVAHLEAGAVERLRAYAAAGGLVVLFPGRHTDRRAWNQWGLAPASLRKLLELDPQEPMKVTWTAPTSPVVASLPAEGLDRVAIRRLYELEPAPDAQVLATTDGGQPFLVQAQVGKGKVYAFAISCQADFSNLPFTPVFLPSVHRTVLSHLVEAGEPLSRPTGVRLEVSVPPQGHRVRVPDGRALPLRPVEGEPGRAAFVDTEQAGIYRLVAADGGAGEGEPFAALNVPPEESALQRIGPATVRQLLPDHSVRFVRADGGGGQLREGGGEQTAASSFPLAVLALAFLLGETVLAWSASRPSGGGRGETETNKPRGAANGETRT